MLDRPLQPPACLGAPRVASAFQRWVSWVTGGSLKGEGGCVGPCNPASPVHRWDQWVRAQGYAPHEVLRGQVTEFQGQSQRLKMWPQLQMLPLPLPRCGILG